MAEALGLLQLYPDPNVRPELTGAVVEAIDIVAIHGIGTAYASTEQNGLDSFSATTNDGRKVIWLRDFLPNAIPYSRVLLFRYDASLFQTYLSTALQDLSEKFLSDLLEARKSDPHRPIFYVAHSLGGLVLKAALLLAPRNPRFAPVNDAARGALFFGTPHRGDYPNSSPESIIETILEKLYLRQPSRKSISACPSPLPSFHPAQQLFGGSLPDFLEVISFYETIGTVVPKWNATVGHRHEEFISLHASHNDICKFKSPHDINYKTVKGALLSLVEETFLSDPARKHLDYSSAQLLRRLSTADHGQPRYRIPNSSPGTCQWLRSNEVFSKWLSTDSSVNTMWLTGVAGCGKTTMANSLVSSMLQDVRIRNEHLPDSSQDRTNVLENSTAKVLSYFCSMSAPPRNAVDVLRALLHQLLAAELSLMGHVSPDQRLRALQQTIPGSVLVNILRDVADAANLRIFIVIDGLDELEDSILDDLLEALHPVSHSVNKAHIEWWPHSPAQSLKILFTSRPAPYIDAYKSSGSHIIDLSEDEAAESVSQDIYRHVSSAVQSWNYTEGRVEAITKRVIERSAGVFLWVNLVVQGILNFEQPRPGPLSLLESLPKDLDSVYAEILHLIHRQKPAVVEISLRILSLLLYCERPLHVSELIDALASTTRSHTPMSKLSRQLQIKDTLKSLSGNLLRIDEYDSTITLSHYTVKEFLLSQPSHPLSTTNKTTIGSNGPLGFERRPFVERQLLYACMSMFDYPGDIHDGLGDIKLQSTTISRPFAKYASIYWHKHLRSTSTEEDIFSDPEFGELARELVNPKSATFRIWFALHYFDYCIEPWERQRYPAYPTLLIVLAFLGDTFSIRNLLRSWPRIVDQSTPDGEEWTALMAAAWVGHEPVVDLLLEFHAGENDVPRRNARTLVQAIERGHVTIAQKLVGQFARVQPTLTLDQTPSSFWDIPIGDRGVTPMLACCGMGAGDILDWLLQLGADPNAHASVSRRLPKVDSVLSPNPLLLDPDPSLPRTPLGSAILAESSRIVTALLDHGADLTLPDVIFVAAGKSHDRWMRLVLEAGADPNAKYERNRSGRTPLHWAAIRGNVDVVKLLISADADVNAKDDSGWTPYELACMSGDLQIVKALSQKTSRTRGSSSNACLPAGLISGIDLCNSIIDLVEFCAHMHQAASFPPRTKQQLFDLVLDRVFDDKDQRYFAPRKEITWGLSHKDLITVVEFLLRHGADLDRKDRSGNTFLQLAASRRWPNVVRVLLNSSSIEIDHLNEKGESAIDIAAALGDVETVQLLASGSMRPVSIRNVLDGGSQAVLGHLRRRVESNHVSLPGLPIKFNPSHTNQEHRLLQGDALAEPQTLLRPANFSRGKFKTVADFLVTKGIADFREVKLVTDDNFSLSNRWKGWFEDCTGTPWIWWPLAPRLTALKAGEVWLTWTCPAGWDHRCKVSSREAQDIEQLLEFQKELSTLDVAAEISSQSNQEASHAEIGSNNSFSRQHQTSHSGRYKDQMTHSHPLTASPASQGSTPRSPSNPALQHPQSARGTQISASFQPPARKAGKRTRRRNHSRPIIAPTSNISSQGGLYVIFKVGLDRYIHIDAAECNTDPKFFGKLKSEYKKERGWLRKWFSIWRYHHCNFDKYVRSWGDLISAQSNGSRTSNFLPEAPHDIDYVYTRKNCLQGEAPISQLEFRNMFFACRRSCCWWYRLIHQCKAPTISPDSPRWRPPTDASLQLIPKRKTKWDISENHRDEAWGLTAFELPSFFFFLTYLVVSAVAPVSFWVLWLSLWDHQGDLQNAFIPFGTWAILWGWIWQDVASNKWNTDREW